MIFLLHLTHFDRSNMLCWWFWKVPQWFKACIFPSEAFPFLGYLTTMVNKIVSDYFKSCQQGFKQLDQLSQWLNHTLRKVRKETKAFCKDQAKHGQMDVWMIAYAWVYVDSFLQFGDRCSFCPQLSDGLVRLYPPLSDGLSIQSQKTTWKNC